MATGTIVPSPAKGQPFEMQADALHVIGWVEVDRNCIAALYVSPSRARTGVGSRLLAHAESSIQSSGCTAVYLDASQNALDYYLRRGYLRCGPADSDGAWPLRKDLAAVTPNQGMEPTR